MKPLKRIGRFWSVRVGLRHRALAVQASEDELVWVWIGTLQEHTQVSAAPIDTLPSGRASRFQQSPTSCTRGSRASTAHAIWLMTNGRQVA
jgi:hypothetical protein